MSPLFYVQDYQQTPFNGRPSESRITPFRQFKKHGVENALKTSRPTFLFVLYVTQQKLFTED